MKKGTRAEADEQKDLFRWIRSKQVEIPELCLAFSTLNGVRLAPKLQKEMKEQGNKKGVPDVILPVVTKEFPGLFVEMKNVSGGSVSPEQKKFICMLKKQGYRAEVAKGYLEAKRIIMDYLGIEV